MQKNSGITGRLPACGRGIGYGYSGLHLCGSAAIAEVFGVSRMTVAQWKEAGAPIYRVGKKDQASYAELWAWIKLNIDENDAS